MIDEKNNRNLNISQHFNLIYKIKKIKPQMNCRCF